MLVIMTNIKICLRKKIELYVGNSISRNNTANPCIVDMKPIFVKNYNLEEAILYHLKFGYLSNIGNKANIKLVAINDNA